VSKTICAIIWHFEGQEKQIYVRSTVTWLSSLTASDSSFEKVASFCNKTITNLLLVLYYTFLLRQ